MKLFEFRKYLDRLTNHNSNDPVVNRTYAGPLSMTDLIVHMPQSSWDYAEWLEDTGRHSVMFWLFLCESEPAQDITLSQQMMNALWLDACQRYANGDAVPFEGSPGNFGMWFTPANDF